MATAVSNFSWQFGIKADNMLITQNTQNTQIPYDMHRGDSIPRFISTLVSHARGTKEIYESYLRTLRQAVGRPLDLIERAKEREWR